MFGFSHFVSIAMANKYLLQIKNEHCYRKKTPSYRRKNDRGYHYFLQNKPEQATNKCILKEQDIPLL